MSKDKFFELLEKEGMDGVLRKYMPIEILYEEKLERIAELEAQLVYTKKHTWCAYCGFEIPIDDESATKISEHIKTCDKHPMRTVEAQLATVTKERDDARAIIELQSIQINQLTNKPSGTFTTT